MENNLKKNLLFNTLGLKKKYQYFKKVQSKVLKLKSFVHEKKSYKNLNYSLLKKREIDCKKQTDGFIIIYIVSFFFTSTNTFLHVTDSLGNLKFRSTAGLLNFKGRQKKSRLLVLNRFLRELKKLKTRMLKNKPIALHLNNVGFYKYFIVKNLKKYYFIRFVKSYEMYSYNGCRKRKKLRKR